VNLSAAPHGLAACGRQTSSTRSTKYIVSTYRKAATARLDDFVGPKTRAVPLNGVHYTA
jgi:hypothetical protein